MTLNTAFALTRAAALARIAAARPADYARRRNVIEGAVVQLSPSIAHGLIRSPEVLIAVASQHRLDVQRKFVFQLGSREPFAMFERIGGDPILQTVRVGWPRLSRTTFLINPNTPNI